MKSPSYTTHRIMKRTYSLLCIILFAIVVSEQSIGQPVQPLPDASWDKLPRWRGFNLLDKFFVTKNRPFVEKDFQLIHQLGFNFVRLPMDYRCWIVDGDWEKFDEKTLVEIDQAVEWGNQYGIHVMLNFHRAPGYTVASPKEPTNLWTDEKTQEVCCKHWAMFAKRYKGIPNRQVSFNLVNEPGGISDDVYLTVAKKMADAIRKEDPERLIISDGLAWGPKAFHGTKELQMALSGRGYAPFEVSHYKASWMDGVNSSTLPTWPLPVNNGLLFGSAKKPQQAPIIIEGPFTEQVTLTLHLVQVSSPALFYVNANDKPIFERAFKPNDGEGEWKTLPERQNQNGFYERDYTIVIPVGTNRVDIGVKTGDWLTISKLSLKSDSGKGVVVDMKTQWNPDPASHWQYSAADGTLHAIAVKNREYLVKTMIEPWIEVERTGVGVMVGEFGCYNKTPHDVALHWMEDCLKNWQEAGWGWALWNFHGGLGVFDSGRTDIEYEDFHGYQLDRKMLDLLQKY